MSAEKRIHAAHQRAYRKRQRAKGMREIHIWCYPDQVARLRQYARTLRWTPRDAQS